MLRLIKTSEGEYRIEGLRQEHVLRIYSSLDSVRQRSDYIAELDVLTSILKMDMENLNKKDKS
jgi:hypothetical protein